MLDFDGLELEAGFYYMSLEAWDAHGRTARTAVVFTVSRLVPLAPEDFSVTRGTTVNAVRLAWSPPDDAETYEIWRADHAAGTSARLHAELAAPADAYLDADVIAGRRYGYQVRALNRFGSGDFSPIVEGWSLLGPAVMGNGRRHELELPAGERRVTVALLLGAGAYAGMDCDWWVVAHDVNAGRFYYLDGNMEFQPLDDPGNLRPARQGPLFDIEHPFALLTALPAPPSAGSVYRFYFGIDTVMNGRLDEDWLTYDTLQLLYR